MNRTYLPHYHIRWSGKAALDWECFATPQEAEGRAGELVRQGETYAIEEHGKTCERCLATLNLKHEHGTRADNVTRNVGPNSQFKYPWQQLVSDAFMESRFDYLPGRVNAAEHAISARLLKDGPIEPDERTALKEALRALRTLLSEPKKSEEESDSNSEVA